MTKEMLTMKLQRRGANVPWGFSLAGGKDQVSSRKNANKFEIEQKWIMNLIEQSIFNHRLSG